MKTKSIRVVGIILCVIGLGGSLLYAQSTGTFNTVIASNDFRQMSASDSSYFLGKLGVGTTNPTTNLEVYEPGSDGVQLRMGDQYGAYAIGRSGANGMLQFSGTQTGYVGYVFDTKVGIGTVMPYAVLDVIAPVDYGTLPLLRVYQVAGYPCDNDYICWGSAWGPCYGGIRAGGCFAWDTQIWGYGGLSLRAGSYDGYNPQIAIRTTGYVGIGTNSPSEKLHVAGRGRFDQGVVYTMNLGDISMGTFTNSP